MQAIEKWMGRHPTTVNITIICIAATIIAALYLGVDLSWLPALLSKLVAAITG